MNLNVWEVFEKIEKAKTRKERIQILKDHSQHWAMRDVLQGTFDDRVQWNLPKGAVPFTPNAEDAPTPSSLQKQHMNFKYFVSGLRESENLITVKRERMFVDMLESIDSRDAQILVSMINKKPPCAGLTKKIVQEALPELIPN
jgi:hypothetical protein